VSAINVDETGCFAAACTAGVGIGLFRSAEEPVRSWVHPVQTFEPDPARHKIYDSIFADYVQLCQAVSPVSHSVSARRRQAL